MIPPGAVTLGILAGGRGERFGGRDKAWIEHDGRPLLARATQRLSGDFAARLASARHPDPRHDELGLVPVLDPIVVRTTGLGLSGNAVTGHLPATAGALSYANTDLVVIMTARPSPNSPIAGYASCLQADQWGRCTVGHFNWVPSALDRAGFEARWCAGGVIAHVCQGTGGGRDTVEFRLEAASGSVLAGGGAGSGGGGGG